MHWLGRLALIVVGLFYGYVAYWMGLAMKEAQLPLEAWNTAEAALYYTWVVVVLFTVGCFVVALRPTTREGVMGGR